MTSNCNVFMVSAYLKSIIAVMSELDKYIDNQHGSKEITIDKNRILVEKLFNDIQRIHNLLPDKITDSNEKPVESCYDNSMNKDLSESFAVQPSNDLDHIYNPPTTHQKNTETMRLMQSCDDSDDDFNQTEQSLQLSNLIYDSDDEIFNNTSKSLPTINKISQSYPKLSKVNEDFNNTTVSLPNVIDNLTK
jgi:hypothetical protein